MSDTEDLAELVRHLEETAMAESAAAQRSVLTPNIAELYVQSSAKFARWRALVERLGAERTCKDSLQVDTPPDPGAKPCVD